MMHISEVCLHRGNINYREVQAHTSSCVLEIITNHVRVADKQFR